MQHNIIQYNTTQRNATQHNTTQMMGQKEILRYKLK